LSGFNTLITLDVPLFVKTLSLNVETVVVILALGDMKADGLVLASIKLFSGSQIVPI
jgi:hypothetical protein